MDGLDWIGEDRIGWTDSYMPPDPNMIFPRDGISFFGVFDGHGGSEAGPCC